MAPTPVLPEAASVGALSRPIEASKAAVRTGCFTSTPAVRFAQTASMTGRRRKGRDLPQSLRRGQSHRHRDFVGSSSLPV